MALKTNAHKQYPYDIPPPPKPEQISKALNKRDLWNALEFFRIEALLRSPTVWALYRNASQRASRRRGDACPETKNMQQWVAWYGQSKVQLRGRACAHVRKLLWDGSLRDHKAVTDGWAILLGSHHRHLKLDMGPMVSLLLDKNDERRSSFRISEGVEDLCILAREYNYSPSLQELQMEPRRFLYLKIDPVVAPTANIKNLSDFLKKHHKSVMATVEKPTIDPITGEQTIPFHPRTPPPITDVCAWLKYIQCYDLRHLQGFTYGQIATEVYGSNRLRETAEKAVIRVEQLINAAQVNAWPPVFPAR